jgi:hypothetical protein
LFLKKSKYVLEHILYAAESNPPLAAEIGETRLQISNPGVIDCYQQLEAECAKERPLWRTEAERRFPARTTASASMEQQCRKQNQLSAEQHRVPKVLNNANP